MSTRANDGAFTIDLKAFERRMNDIEKKHLPAAAASYLSGIAFRARFHTHNRINEDFDRPSPFTQKAFIVKMAKASDRERMQATMEARPIQAKYLQHQVYGGIRRKGDHGSGPHDLFLYSIQKTKFGGVDQKYLKKVSRQNKAEKKKRKALSTQRAAARAAGNAKALQKLKWVTKSRNKPGVFFGEIAGVKGYWERPERTLRSDKRRKGIRSVTWKGYAKPTLLMAMGLTAKYEPRLRYNKAIELAMRDRATQAWFDYELARKMNPTANIPMPN